MGFYLFLVELALEFSTGLAQKSLIKQRNSRKGEEMDELGQRQANLSFWCIGSVAIIDFYRGAQGPVGSSSVQNEPRRCSTS